MKIDHIALYVNELEEVKAFFVRFFGAVSNEMYHNPRTGLRTYILSLSRPDMKDEAKDMFRTGYIHLSFAVGSQSEVDRLTGLLYDNGYRVVSGPRITGDGYYESCIEGPEGNLIEITE